MATQPGPGRTLLVNASVVDVRTGAVGEGHELVLEGDRIHSIHRAGEAPRLGGEVVVDVERAYVVPGFIDMHVHALNLPDPTGTLQLMLASGITGFRQMSGSSTLTRALRSGSIPLPLESPALLALCGEILSPGNASTPQQAAEMVRAEHDEGVDFIKIAAVSPAAFESALREAARLGLTVAGHLPAATDPRDAARAGFAIEHLGPGIPMLAACSSDEAAIRARLAEHPEIRLPPLPRPLLTRLLAAVLPRVVVNPVARASRESVALIEHAIAAFDESKARELAQLFAEQGTWLTPTLVRQLTSQLADAPALAADPNLRYVPEATLRIWRRSAARYVKKYSPEQRAVFHAEHALELRLVAIFQQAGVRMLTGSDATGAGWVVPGPSLHTEFDLLGQAGVSSLPILQMATLNAAEFLGIADRTGTVEPGRAADLVFLGSDPSTSAAGLHDVRGVVRAGRHYSAAELAALKDRVAGARTVA